LVDRFGLRSEEDAYILKIAEGMKSDRHDIMGRRWTKMWVRQRKTLDYHMPPLRVTSRARKHRKIDFGRRESERRIEQNNSTYS
jgi:hypothetical protein